MTDRHAEVAPRQAARIAGYGYLVIFVLAIFANFFVRERLIQPGDAAATASNIIGSQALFRLGLVTFLMVFAVDVAIAWALYVFLRQVNRDLSLLTAWFRLVYTILLGVAVIFLVLQLVSGEGYLTAFAIGQRDVQLLAVPGGVQLRLAHRPGRVRHPPGAAGGGWSSGPVPSPGSWVSCCSWRVRAM